MQDNFFETNPDLSRHPKQVFWICFKFFKYLFSIFVFVWVNGELMELRAKFWNFWIDIHRAIICQSWLLLSTFFKQLLGGYIVRHVGRDMVDGHIRWQDGPSVTRVLLLLSLKQKVSSWCLRFRHRLIEVASPPSNVAPRCCSTIIFILKPTLKPKFILELNCHPYSTAVHTKVLHKEYSRWSSVGCSMYKSGEN